MLKTCSILGRPFEGLPMRITSLSARMILSGLNEYGNDETQIVEVTLGQYRALLRDHVELSDRVKELEDRLAASLRRSAS